MPFVLAAVPASPWCRATWWSTPNCSVTPAPGEERPTAPKADSGDGPRDARRRRARPGMKRVDVFTLVPDAFSWFFRQHPVSTAIESGSVDDRRPQHPGIQPAATP